MFKVTAENGDLVFEGTATCFGGPGDTADNGIGAWGFNYREFASDLPYCALPLRGSVLSLADSPVPAGIPHFQPVRVFDVVRGSSCWASFVDIGPEGGLESGAVIDLGPAVVRALGYTSNPDVWSATVRVRIPGCAHLLASK